jgi:3D (Asp-Asp-Asp) domain-containing protein
MTLRAFLRLFALAAAAMLCACVSTQQQQQQQKPKGTLTQREQPKAGLATKPGEAISKSAQKRMYVRTTAYHHSEPGGRVTAVGGYLRPVHSAAADWSWLPAGTKFRIVETGEEYVVEDYGSALIGKYTIDLYKSTRSAMNAWGVRYVHIEITQMGSYPVSLAVLAPRQKYAHVRAMVAGLKKRLL